MSERNLKALLIHLLQKHHLLSAGEMLEKLEQQGKQYNKTSVYRALEQLQNEEILCQHFFDKNQATYELREHHHAHLVCEKCGKVEMVKCQYHQPKKLKKFRISHHHLTLMGVCEECGK